MAETKAAVEFAEAHRALYYELFDRIQASITSAAANGRTVREPSTAAMYAVNALLAYPEGNDLLRRIVAHLDDGETTRTGRGQS